MSEPRRRRADVILEPSYVEGLGDKTIEDVRAMHEECMEVETEVSYVRRLAQGRLDIVQAELDRRAAGGTIGDLVAALPQILADDGPRADPVTSRLPRHLAPAPAIEWKRGLEYLITDATLVNLPTLSEEELRSALGKLQELEAETSARRRSLHDVIDKIEAELAARHAVGRS
jgi:RsiG-like